MRAPKASASHMSLWFALVFVVAACSDDPVGPPRPAAVPGAQPAAIMTFDDEMARIARDEVPGFGGYFIDDKGIPVVQLVQAPSGAAQVGVQEAAEKVIRRERARMRTPVLRPRFQTARYDFAQLKAWQDSLIGAVGLKENYFLDVDEVTNKVFVGAADAQVRELVRKEAGRIGIPQNAIDIQIAALPAPRVDLREFWRGVAGGLQIGGNVGTCSLGFNALSGGVDYFVTASHCSTKQFGLDGTVQGQPSQSYRLGAEALDPGLRLPCPEWNWFVSCRFSDASMYRYDAGVQVERGRIMQTLYPVAGQPGPRTIYESDPYFNIKWNRNSTSDAPVGSELHKMGRTSGWTGGWVSRACVTIGNPNLRCQWVSNIWSEPGDSGSPIFLPSTIPWPSASLYGVLWGGPPGNWNETWHSPMSGVERDFGALNVLRPAPPPPPPPPGISGPTAIPQYGFGAWSYYNPNVPQCSWFVDQAPVQQGDCTLFYTFYDVFAWHYIEVAAGITSTYGGSLASIGVYVTDPNGGLEMMKQGQPTGARRLVQRPAR